MIESSHNPDQVTSPDKFEEDAILEQSLRPSRFDEFVGQEETVEEKDRIVVFFAGHGMTLDLFKGGELGYLLPEDADPNNLYLTSLPMDELKRISNMSAAKHILFLVDACYGGLAAVETRGLPTQTPGYLEKITRDMGRHIITAGGRGEQVIEAPVWGHSAFTKNLISGLENWMADSDADGIITASELGVYLQKKVTIDSENRQTPQSRKLTSGEGEFIFINAQPKIDETVNEISNNSEVVAQILLELHELKEQISPEEGKSYQKQIKPVKQDLLYKNNNRLTVIFPFGYSVTPQAELNTHIEGVHKTNENDYSPTFQVKRKANRAISFGIAVNKIITQKYGLELGFKRIQYINPVRTVSTNYGYDNNIGINPGLEYREEYQDINHNTYYLSLNSNVIEKVIFNIPISIFIGVGLNYSSVNLLYSKNSKIATWIGNIQKHTEEWPSNNYSGQGMGYQMQIASKFDLFPRLGVHFSYHLIQGYRGTLIGKTKKIETIYYNIGHTLNKTNYDNHILEDRYGNPLNLNFFYQMMEVRLDYAL